MVLNGHSGDVMMKKNLSTSLKKLTFSVGILLLAAPAVHLSLIHI